MYCLYACMHVCMYIEVVRNAILCHDTCMYGPFNLDWYGAATRLSVERGVRLRHMRTQDEHDSLCTHAHAVTAHHNDRLYNTIQL